MSMLNIFNVSGSAASAQSQRLNIVASNLANVDTVAGPNGQAYKARQVTTTLTATQPGHIGPDGSSGGANNGALNGATFSTLQYAAPSQTNLDRNTVDMDRERASFADNTVKYEAALRFLGAHVKTTLSAITGQ